nr:hypothetical protein [Tanacetum cinerariifolium]
MDDALVPHAKRLRIGRRNFFLLLEIKSKESTLQLVYDVLRLTPFFKAFLVIADVLKIYMQEFWATATVHHHAIRFKMDNKKHIINLKSFRDMLHICPRLPGQSFIESPFEEEILAFLHSLGHSGAIRKLTDVNIYKLHQPWRSFVPSSTSAKPGKAQDMIAYGNDDDDEEKGGNDEQASDEEEFIHPSVSTHTKEEPRDEESFDPIPETPEDTDDKGNGEENLGINVGRKEGHDEEEEEDELYRDTQTLVAPLPMSAPTITLSTIATITTTQQAPIPPTTALSTLIQDLPNFGSLFGFDNRLRTLEAVAADLSEMELKKILIEKMKGNKSIQRSNEQRNLYKALVEAYVSDKIILATYGETVTLKRRHDDDADKGEEPFAGSDRGSKRRRERKEPESASALKEKATKSAGKSTQGIIAVTELKIFDWHNYKHLDWITSKNALLLTSLFECFTRSIIIQSRVEDLQLGVESYQKKLNLTRPDTYRSDLKRKEAYSAYSNPRGFIYQNKDKQMRLIQIDELHKFSDRTLIDVRTALDDRLKGIRMKYLPQSIWRKSNKDRAAAII